MTLIDTSAWLFALRRNFHPAVKERIDALLKENDVAIIGIIQLELLGGAKFEEEYTRLKTRLESLYFIESIKSVWDTASKLAFDLRRKGVTVPHTDIYIAAAAIQENAVLLHADSHFDHIAKHSTLKVESFASLINQTNQKTD